MKKILSVFGTRPEAIKMVPVVKQIEKSPWLESVVCVTAQHREMVDQVVRLFAIRSQYDLDLMEANQDLTDITASILTGLRKVLRAEKPDIVLVQGDTTTAFAAALAAFYEQVPVGHVEAGLRTGNLSSPYPEEANRQLIGRLAWLHFAPTQVSRSNLIAEKIRPECIFVTGNTVIDALFEARSRLATQADLAPSVAADIQPVISSPKPFVLVTGHRRENFGRGMQAICSALKQIATRRPDLNIVYPVHLNPNVQKPVFEQLGNLANIYLLAPLDYLSFVLLMDRCHLVLTDSGGIQEEAPSFGKPVLVMRDTTERPEAVDVGTVKLVGTRETEIVKQVLRLLDDQAFYDQMARAHNPYGDGHAAEYIVDILEKQLA